ncbi:MAG: CRISPR-associated protein Cas6, partial [Cytophagales bacterium]|nr:CRISPR-associated protein Cas6 [Cytophagales bacterium]
ARIVFSLKNKGAIVPFHHQHLLARMIKGILGDGMDSDLTNLGNYHFSGLKGQTKVIRAGLQFFSNRVTLVFATSQTDFLFYFLQQLFAHEQLELGALRLHPLFVEEELPQGLKEKTKYVCLSPLVVVRADFNDSEGKQFIHPEEESFSELLNQVTAERMQAAGLVSFPPLRISPDIAYLRKIQDSQKKFARIYTVFENDVPYEVRGYTLPLSIEAPLEVHQFLYDQGIGLYTQLGFGMLDLVQLVGERKTAPLWPESFGMALSGR